MGLCTPGVSLGYLIDGSLTATLAPGHGKFGKLGHGDEKSTNVPVVVAALADWKVTQVAAGYAHTACVTEAGCLYTWGSGTRGRLGQGTEEGTCVPTLHEISGAPAESKMVQVVAGDAFTAAVTADGALYTWGDGSHGKLGHGDEASICVPMLVDKEYLGGVRVVQVAAGSRHMACLTEDGSLYTWGCSPCGQLGHGNAEHANVPGKVHLM